MDAESRDVELLERAAGGDESALRPLLKRHGPEVRGRSQGRIDRKWRTLLDEDDVMQVAYLEALLHANTLRARDVPTFVAWLTRIAENALRDAIRGLQRQKRPGPTSRIEAAGDGDSGTKLLDFLGATTTTPSRHAARDDARRVLDDAIGRLPQDYGPVVRLVDLEGRSTGEAAAVLRRSVGAVCMLRATAAG